MEYFGSTIPIRFKAYTFSIRTPRFSAYFDGARDVRTHCYVFPVVARDIFSRFWFSGIYNKIVS